MAFLTPNGQLIDLEAADRKLLLDSIATRRRGQQEENRSMLQAALADRLAAREEEQAALDREANQSQFLLENQLAGRELEQNKELFKLEQKGFADRIREQREYDESRQKRVDEMTIQQEEQTASSLATRLNRIMDAGKTRMPTPAYLNSLQPPPEVAQLGAEAVKNWKEAQINIWRQGWMEDQIQRQIPIEAERYLIRKEDGTWGVSPDYFLHRRARAGLAPLPATTLTQALTDSGPPPPPPPQLPPATATTPQPPAGSGMTMSGFIRALMSGGQPTGFMSGMPSAPRRAASVAPAAPAFTIPNGGVYADTEIFGYEP